MTLRFVQVDAFADRAFGGNPAAVMPLDAWLDDATLLGIAAENNLSETAFLVPDASGAADHELRWFTPTVEVALCGHATLASGHVLLGDAPHLSRVTFRTRRAGLLAVGRAPGGGYLMELPTYPTLPRPMPQTVAAMRAEPIETRWHEDGYAILVYPDAAAVRALAPDYAALRPLGDILVIATAPGEDSDVLSRVFAPGAGIDEDPVTGSAHAVLAPYWAERLGRAEFSAYQASARGGRIGCRLEGDRVVLHGQCVTVIEGRFLLP